MPTTTADDGVCSAVRTLLLNLPENCHCYWWESSQLHKLLRRGGLPLLPLDPDGGHLIKCISNGYYDTAEHDKSLKGTGLLEPTRIRAISSDVGKYIWTFHNIS